MDPFASFDNISPSTANVMKAKVLFDYTAQAANQIGLKKGQIITLSQKGAPGSWSKGEEIGTGKSGFFPSDYVEVLPMQQQQLTSNNTIDLMSNPVTTTSTKSNINIMAKVLFDFAGSNPNEMKLTLGETIEITLKGPTGGWSKGLKGAFPTDYVEFLSPQAQPIPTTTFTPATKKVAASTHVNTSVKSVVKQVIDPFAVDPFSHFDNVEPVDVNSISNSSISNNNTTSGGGGAVSQVTKSIPDDLFNNTSTNTTSNTNNNINNNTINNQVKSVDIFASNTTSSNSSVIQTNTAKSTIVKPVKSSRHDNTATKIKTVYAKVKYSRDGSSDRELNIELNETVTVLKQEGEWWYGSSLNTGEIDKSVFYLIYFSYFIFLNYL
jgi:hypothetical protein